MNRSNSIELICIFILACLCAAIMPLQVIHRREALELRGRVEVIEAYQKMVNSYVEWSLSNGVTNAVPVTDEKPAE